MAFNSTAADLNKENINGLLGCHNSWQRVELSYIAKILNGFAFKSTGFNNNGQGERIIRIRDVVPSDTKTFYSGEIPEGYWINTGDIVIGMDGDFNLAWWNSPPALLNQRVCKVDNLCEQYNKRFLFRLLPGYLNAINANTSSVTVKHLSSKTLEQLLIPLPPLAEQKVIADKLDTLLAQVETINARLERISEILKHFRQSVLAVAVSGKLTERWRVDKSFEWSMITIGDLGEVKGGKRIPKGEELTEFDTGFPYVRAGQLKQGTVISTEEARSKQLFLRLETQSMISRYTVKKGDLYLTIVGASIGDAGVIPDNYDGANLTENAAKITEFKKPLVSSFFSYWLRSPELQDLIKLEIKSGAQGKLALNRIKQLPAPYPKKEEQTEIVRRVEQLFAYADQIEQQVKNAQARVNNLTQSILAKAFRGELTAEWRAANPDLITGENSAEALLARIKAEREAQAPKARRKTSAT